MPIVPPTIPTLTAAQQLSRDSTAASVGGTMAACGTPATYVPVGTDPEGVDAVGTEIHVELWMNDVAGMINAAGGRLPARLLSAGAPGMTLRGRVSVPMPLEGELVPVDAGVTASGGVWRLRDGDRLTFRGADVGLPAQQSVTLAVRNVTAGHGVWTAEVNGA